LLLSKYAFTNINKTRLNTIKDCVFDTQKSSDEVRQNIQETLEQEERGFRLTREINQHKSKLVEKEAQVIQQKKLIQLKLEKLKQKRQLIENRKMDLTDSIERCVSGTEDLQENEQVLEKNIKMRQTMFHTLNRRKKELIADLFSIYPIEQVSFFIAVFKKK
jgi:hypothetical protein